MIDIYMIMLHYTWAWLWKFVNSDFFASVITAICTVYIALHYRHKEKRDALIMELSNTNEAIHQAGDILNTFLNFKRQIAQPFKIEFNKLAEEFQQYHQNPQGGIFHWQPNLKNIEFPWVPIERLHKVIGDRIRVIGRPLTLLPVLSRALRSLEQSVRGRNELIGEYKGNPSFYENSEALYTKFLGLRDKHGHIDHSYSERIDHIYENTEDVIMYSSLLVEDLINHAKYIKRSLKGKGYTVATIDLQKIHETGLMPADSEKYQDWINMKV